MDIQLSDREKIPDKSILGMMKHFIEAVNDMDSTVMIPSRLIDMQLHVDNEEEQMNKTNGNVNNSLVKTNIANRDLFTYFTLLRTIKRDLVKGTMSNSGTEDSDSSEEEDCEQAKQAAGLFREHLRGLFNVLEQLTEMAKCLTSKYQQETGDFQTCPKPKSFTV